MVTVKMALTDTTSFQRSESDSVFIPTMNPKPQRVKRPVSVSVNCISMWDRKCHSASASLVDQHSPQRCLVTISPSFCSWLLAAFSLCLFFSLFSFLDSLFLNLFHTHISLLTPVYLSTPLFFSPSSSSVSSRSAWRRFRSQTPHEPWPPQWDINRRGGGQQDQLPGGMRVESKK